jgi:hypothetical protein
MGSQPSSFVARLVAAGGLADGKSCANANTVSARSLNAVDAAELSSLGDGDVRKNCHGVRPVCDRTHGMLPIDASEEA